MSQSAGRWKSQYRRHRTNKALQKKRSISGTFVKKKQKQVTPKYQTYQWGEEEEDMNYRVRDPVVRSDFFLIPDNPVYEHYFDGLDALLYGKRDPSQKTERTRKPAPPPPQEQPEPEPEPELRQQPPPSTAKKIRRTVKPKMVEVPKKVLKRRTHVKFDEDNDA
eukprot:TRINITY_DN14815_c2_g1_i1.p1 TRINITY_DN14815_c2_g1~~TRINITY_DN14815_c2_g1_i1.p1  ORF type:complete len:164 (+),score=34.71 TRINITY_DN14815_c2_g1_i1:43-534(+)